MMIQLERRELELLRSYLDREQYERAKGMLQVLMDTSLDSASKIFLDKDQTELFGLEISSVRDLSLPTEHPLLSGLPDVTEKFPATIPELRWDKATYGILRLLSEGTEFQTQINEMLSPWNHGGVGQVSSSVRRAACHLLNSGNVPIRVTENMLEHLSGFEFWGALSFATGIPATQLASKKERGVRLTRTRKLEYAHTLIDFSR